MQNKFNILLANPPCRIDIGKGLEKFFVRAGSRWPFSIIKKEKIRAEYSPFPFYLAYTAALLEAKGFLVLVNDAVTLNKTKAEFLQETKEQEPDIILYETSTPTIYHDLALAKDLKELLPGIIIVLVGPHVSTFPEQTLQESSFVDYIIVQEYELSFAELAEKLRSKEKVSGISGLTWREEGVIKKNQARLIEPLDQLPKPARHFFPMEYYWDGFCQYKPVVQMHATRGCPFHCNFCLWNQVMYGNGRHRTFNVKRVVEEMKDCQKKYGAREIYFDDDTFTGNRQNVFALCDEIKKTNLKINWSCMGDAMITDEKMIEAMAGAGCIGMKFGVESGDKEVLKTIGKPIVFEKLREVASCLGRHRIKTHATFTFGLLGETKETMQRTIDFAKGLDVDSVQFSITTPFPGTRYYNEVKEKNLLLAKDWSEFDGASTSVVGFEKLTNEEVQEFYCKASGEWLKHKLLQSRWTLRQLYNLNRMRKGQGMCAVFRRCKRGLELVFGQRR